MGKRVPSTNTGAEPSTSNKRRKAPEKQGRLESFFGVPSVPASIPPVAHLVIDVDALDDLAAPSVSQPAAAAATLLLEPTASSSAPTSQKTPGLPLRVPAVPFPTYILSLDPPFFSLDSPSWPSGVSTPYSFLADTLVQLTQTKSRIAIVNILTNTFRLILRHDPAALLSCLYLLSNTFAPPYSPIELGLGSSAVSKAIQSVSGLTPAAVKRLFKETGDPGDVAFMAKSNVGTLVAHPPLRCQAVYDTMLKMAACKGTGAVRTRQLLVEKLLVAAKGEEARFLVRSLLCNLRVGAVRTSLLSALARAVALSPSASSPVPGPSSLFSSVPGLLLRVEPLPSGKNKKKNTDVARIDLATVLQASEELIRRVYARHPNYNDLVAGLLEVGLDGLADSVTLSVGIPLLPTLGSPTRSLDDIYDLTHGLPFTAEFKYDGQRAQIHAIRRDDAPPLVKLFSRHLEDMTDKYPDVVNLVHQVLSRDEQMNSFIIDAEIVAIDAISGQLRPFQELATRARKDVRADNVSVAVCVFVFDLMYLDGEVLLAQPFRSRRTALRAKFPPLADPGQGLAEAAAGGAPARLDHVRSAESEDGREAVEQFWFDAITAEGHIEGLMIKLLDGGEAVTIEHSDGDDLAQKGKGRRKPLPATYEPDKRTNAWLKLKKDYVTGLGDSLDLIPIGAWHGIGRKAQWWSPVLLAIWDTDAGKPVAVCKCMSGFSDVFYKDMRARYSEESGTCSTQPMWECETGGLRPQVYFKPHEVWEIRGADVTLSPVSVAAQGMISKRGLSLRFPRFVRVRDDKAVENASTPVFLADMYRSQNNKKKGGADDFELVDGDLAESTVEDEGEDEDADEEQG